MKNIMNITQYKETFQLFVTGYGQPFNGKPKFNLSYLPRFPPESVVSEKMPKMNGMDFREANGIIQRNQGFHKETNEIIILPNS